MSVDKEIFDHLQDLPSEAQDEVLDFVKFLREKNRKNDWTELSLKSALRGMKEDEGPEYTRKDIVEKI